MPNVLFLTHRIPYPPNRGDRIRSYHLLRFLSERADVHLASLAHEEISPETHRALNQLCARTTHAKVHPYGRWVNGALSVIGGKTATEGLFRSRELHRTLQQWTDDTEFDGVIAFCSSMAQYVPPQLDNVPTVVDLVDVDSEKWLQYAANRRGLKRWLYNLEAKRVRSLEERLARQAKAVTVVSEDEAELFRSFCDVDCVHAIGNGVDTEHFHTDLAVGDVPSAGPMNCVFVGVMDYYPNIEGVCWFCENVWPAVKHQLPEATLSIVGRYPTAEVSALSQFDGVEVTGGVPDVRPYLARAAVSIAPLQIARGVQNKVLEAMSAGLPVIATPAALTGLSLDDEDALVATDANTWQGQLIKLLTDTELRTELALRGREYVERHHSWSRRLAPFGEVLGLQKDSPSYRQAPQPEAAK